MRPFQAGLVLLLGGLLLAGCDGFTLNPAASDAMARDAADANTTPGFDPTLPAPVRPRTDDGDAAIVAAVDNPDRFVSDPERDARRRPEGVLKFFGVRPGMTVLDLYSGGGYYTEIVSYIVGPKGKVVAHNNTPYLNMSKKELAERFLPGRLDNVERMTAENNELVLKPGQFDVVLMVDAFHDIYYVNEKTGWAKIDGPKLLAELYRGIRPGGVLGVVDHVANPGSPPETGGTLHRIDPEIIRRDVTAAGFFYDGQSNVLYNPDDDHTKTVFDPSIRGRTDQVVMRFRKPR